MDLVLKTVKPFGDRGAHIILPIQFLGKKVQVLAVEEIEIMNK